jgi:hypothetical protein
MPPEGEDTQTGRTGRQTMSKDTGKSICEKRIFSTKTNSESMRTTCTPKCPGQKTSTKTSCTPQDKKAGTTLPKMTSAKTPGEWYTSW